MIPKANTVETTVGNTLATTAMTVDASSLPFLMAVLTNLYADPTTAVIREYSTNAWDSHVASGNTDTCIEVTLPTMLSPTFVIKDYGLGLSRHDIENIYTSYGSSTKRESDEFNGQLGFGCKSAFSITDQFVIEANKDGIKCVYSMHLDGVSFGAATLMYEGETDEPNSVSISIPIKGSISVFRSKARAFYYTFTQKVNFLGSEKSEHHYTDDIMYTSEDERLVFLKNNPNVTCTGGVLMGNVLYPHPLVLPEIIIRVDIGEVHFTPSRERILEDAVFEKYVVDLIEDNSKLLQDVLLEGKHLSEEFEFEYFGVQPNFTNLKAPIDAVKIRKAQESLNAKMRLLYKLENSYNKKLYKKAVYLPLTCLKGANLRLVYSSESDFTSVYLESAEPIYAPLSRFSITHDKLTKLSNLSGHLEKFSVNLRENIVLVEVKSNNTDYVFNVQQNKALKFISKRQSDTVVLNVRLNELYVYNKASILNAMLGFTYQDRRMPLPSLYASLEFFENFLRVFGHISPDELTAVIKEVKESEAFKTAPNKSTGIRFYKPRDNAWTTQYSLPSIESKTRTYKGSNLIPYVWIDRDLEKVLSKDIVSSLYSHIIRLCVLDYADVPFIRSSKAAKIRLEKAGYLILDVAELMAEYVDSYMAKHKSLKFITETSHGRNSNFQRKYLVELSDILSLRVNLRYEETFLDMLEDGYLRDALAALQQDSKSSLDAAAINVITNGRLAELSKDNYVWDLTRLHFIYPTYALLHLEKVLDGVYLRGSNYTRPSFTSKGGHMSPKSLEDRIRRLVSVLNSDYKEALNV